jgi:hypothetical protein
LFARERGVGGNQGRLSKQMGLTAAKLQVASLHSEGRWGGRASCPWAGAGGSRALDRPLDVVVVVGEPIGASPSARLSPGSRVVLFAGRCCQRPVLGSGPPFLPRFSPRWVAFPGCMPPPRRDVASTASSGSRVRTCSCRFLLSLKGASEGRSERSVGGRVTNPSLRYHAGLAPGPPPVNRSHDPDEGLMIGKPVII